MPPASFRPQSSPISDPHSGMPNLFPQVALHGRVFSQAPFHLSGSQLICRLLRKALPDHTMNTYTVPPSSYANDLITPRSFCHTWLCMLLFIYLLSFLRAGMASVSFTALSPVPRTWAAHSGCSISFFFPPLRIEPRDSHMLGKCSATKLNL